MQFATYTFSLSIQDSQKVLIRRFLHSIYPQIAETHTSSGEHCLHIMCSTEASTHWGDEQYVITPEFINGIISMQLAHIPLTSERRQCISLCLANVFVSASNVPDIYELARKVYMLGGTFCPLSEQTNVFITGSMDLDAILQAKTMGLPICHPGWIDSCYSSLKFCPFNDFFPSRFLGQRFTTTDLTPAVQKAIREKIELEGGKYSSALDESVSYVVSDHLARSKKVHVALVNKIPIIRTSWILEAEEEPLNWWCMPGHTSNLFHGLEFALADNLPPYVREIIEAHSGQISDHGSLIAPHGSGLRAFSIDWLFDCVEQKVVLRPTEVLHRPLKNVNIDGLTGQTVVVFRLTDEIRHRVSDLLHTVGAVVSYRFVKNAALVIAAKPDEALMKKTMHIPILRPGYVFECARSGQLIDTTGFIIENISCSKRLKDLCDRLKSIGNVQTTRTPICLSDIDQISYDDPTPEPIDITYESRHTTFHEVYICDPLIDILRVHQ